MMPRVSPKCSGENLNMRTLGKCKVKSLRDFYSQTSEMPLCVKIWKRNSRQWFLQKATKVFTSSFFWKKNFLGPLLVGHFHIKFPHSSTA